MLTQNLALSFSFQVYAIGNPFGLDQTLTTGIVSGVKRDIKSITGRPIRGVVQTDAAINPGNSGGPLLDSQGELIGVNTMILSPSGASSGVGFAVPADTVRRVVDQVSPCPSSRPSSAHRRHRTNTPTLVSLSLS